MEGYIKLHRQLLESSVFCSQIGLKIWVWCLLKANYKDKFATIKISKGETSLKVNRGSFVFGRSNAESELKINGSTIYKWLKKLQEESMIELNSSSHYTIITICNYEYYQGVECDEVAATCQPRNSHVAATCQPRNTTNKDKKDNNINNNNIESRKKEFYNNVAVFTNSYPKETLRAFYDYWTEHGVNDRKMRFEKQTSFDINLRLKRWYSKEEKYGTTGVQQKTAEQAHEFNF